MMSRIVRFFWGDMTSEELKRFGLLSATFFMLIGSYWLTRSLKDPMFARFVGYQFQPYAKMLSPFIVLAVVLFYNKLVDLLRKSVLFYYACLAFGVGFLTVGFFVANPHLLENIFSFIPGNILGWFIYFYIESFGSIVIALFLSIIASTMSAESAKKGYGMVYTFGQLGLIAGTSFVGYYSSLQSPNFGYIFALGGIIIGLMPLLVKKYISISPENKAAKIEKAEHKPKTGILEGLKLILSKPYIAGLFVVTIAYEIINTIVEFQMGLSATKIYGVTAQGIAAFAWLKSMNGLAIGVLSTSFALLGTSFVMRKFGLKFCLILFPSLIGITIASIFSFYMFGASLYFLMWAFFVAVVIFKGLSYTLNNPSKEVMYIPTSKDVKFKSKSWIDAFGNRISKAGGGIVTSSLGANLPVLLVFGSMISLGVVGFWIFIAAYVGNTFNKLQKENRIIE